MNFIANLFKIKKNILTKYYIFINDIKIKTNKNIKLLGKVKLSGPITINVQKNATLVLGDNVTISGGLTINPLGRNIHSSIYVGENSMVVIGNHTGMSNVSIWATNKITIGDNVTIGADCLIFDSDIHSLDYMLRKNPKTDVPNAKSLPIIIEEDVFIGTRCIITKGVTIESRSIIAAGSVVTKNIPPDEIWGGNPAKFIKNIQ